MSVKMKAPEGATELNHDGDVYFVVDGLVDVPDEAVVALFSHGYTVDSQGDGEVDLKVARKRRTKAEMEAARAESLAAVVEIAPAEVPSVEDSVTDAVTMPAETGVFNTQFAQ